MTTIATDGYMMAADGQREMCRTIISDNAQKLRRLEDGRIVGTSGDVEYGIKFVEWLRDGGDKPTLPGDSGFSALVLNPDSTVQVFAHECVPMPCPVPFAVGSGMDFAIGAMEAGESPEEAVLIAAKRDPHTGGTVMVMRLEPPLKAVA